MAIKKGLYQHFKGNYYQVIDVAKDSETQQSMVVYRALYGDKGLWLRPLDMFTEVIERDGARQQRFAYCSQQTQVLEVATLDIIAGQEKEFEQAFEPAQAIISSMSGYISHQLKQCLEQQSRYQLEVEWQNVESHTLNFKNSDEYQQWRELLHHFFSQTPSVLHYQNLN